MSTDRRRKTFRSTWHPPTQTTTPAVLSAREAQVLVGICLGHTNAEIGRTLHLTEDTVKTLAKRLYRKLGARDRPHAVALAHAHPPLVVSRRTP